MSEVQIVQPDSIAPDLTTSQAEQANLKKVTHKFLFPPSLFRDPLNERLSLFCDLETLDVDVKQSLKLDVTIYMEQLTEFDVFMDWVKKYSYWVLLFFGFVFSLPSFLVAQSWFKVQPPEYTAASGSLLIIVTIICYFLLMHLFIWPNFFTLPKFFRIETVKTLFIWHLVVSFCYMILSVFIFTSGKISDASGIVPYISYIVLVALIGNLGFEFLYFFVVSFFVVLGPIVAERLWAGHYPLATMIYQLIKALRSIEQSKQRSTIDLHARRKQLAAIEIASRCLESFLPEQLRCGDIVTDAWLKEVMQEAANALREKKRWILTPKADTYGYLTRSLADMLLCVIGGDWDRLERIKYAQLAHPYLWRTRLFRTISLIVEATLPLLIGIGVVVFHPLSNLFPIPGYIDGYLIIGPLFWGIITIVEALDPNFNDKIDTLKNVLNLLPGDNSTKPAK